MKKHLCAAHSGFIRQACHRTQVGQDMNEFDDMGSDEGSHLGPKPDKGAVVHSSPGEADFDGLPGDQLPTRESVKRKFNDSAPAPPPQSAE